MKEEKPRKVLFYLSIDNVDTHAHEARLAGAHGERTLAGGGKVRAAGVRVCVSIRICTRACASRVRSSSRIRLRLRLGRIRHCARAAHGHIRLVHRGRVHIGLDVGICDCHGRIHGERTGAVEDRMEE